MFLRTVKVRAPGDTFYEYLRLVEAYREDGQRKHRIVLNLGRKDLLAPHVDLLFDRGLIGFGDGGDVLVSPRLDRLDLKRLGLNQACEKGGPPFHERQAAYLAFHRARILLP